MAYKIRWFGWRPDLPDQRDIKYGAPSKIYKNLPPAIDQRSQMPPVFDQEALGSCTGNATCGQCWHLALKDPRPNDFMPSRLFQYYATRILERTVRIDSGASIRNSIKSVVRYGICPEAYWPYVIRKFAHKPPQKAFKVARKELVRLYQAVPQRPEQIKSVLSTGYTVNFGFTVYESFESDVVTETGVMPMPKPSEEILGGHAVLLVGYDDEKQLYIVRNSWGDTWGDKGYFYMPYDFVHNKIYAADFWTINAVP